MGYIQEIGSALDDLMTCTITQMKDDVNLSCVPMKYGPSEDIFQHPEHIQLFLLHHGKLVYSGCKI